MKLSDNRKEGSQKKSIKIHLKEVFEGLLVYGIDAPDVLYFKMQSSDIYAA